MKTRLIAISAMLALCLAPAVYADGIFSATCELVEPGVYVYTLYNNGTEDEVPWTMDLDWILDWDEGQDPYMPFEITAAPEGQDWFANDFLPYPAFDSIGIDPVGGGSVAGFEITAGEPAAYFRVFYQDADFQVVDQVGSVTDLTSPIPEPGSLAAMLSGLVGMGLIRRRRA